MPDERQQHLAVHLHRHRTGAPGRIKLCRTGSQCRGVLRRFPACRGTWIRVKPDALRGGEGGQIGGGVRPVPGQHGQRPDHGHSGDQQHQRQEPE
jgi:hypothetical protein